MSLLATIQEQLQQVDELIAKLEVGVASETSPRPSISANIRSLEKERRVLQQEFFRAAQLAEVDVYRYRIINKSRATIEGLTSAWREFQNMLNAVYDAAGGTGAKKKTRRSRSGKPAEFGLPQLGFGYSFHGSIGIAMTLPKADGAIFQDSVVEEATNNIFDIAAAAGQPDKLHALARRLGPEPIRAVYKWVECHVQYQFGVGIEWQRDEEHKRALTVQVEEFAILRDELSGTTVDVKLSVTGDLVIVDSVNGEFTIHADDGTKIVGAYDTAISREQAARVPARYRADITKTTKVVSIDSEEQTETYFLDDLQSLDKQQ